MFGINLALKTRTPINSDPVLSYTTGQRVWFDANDSSTVLNNSDAVAALNDGVKTWQDKSGNAYHLTQSTVGSRPALTTSALLNNRRVLSFDGLDDFLLKTGDTILSSGMTVFVAWVIESGTSATGDLFSGGAGDVALLRGNSEASAGVSMNKRMWNGGYSTNIVHTYGVGYYSSMIFNGLTSVYYLNGVSAFSGTTSGTGSGLGISIGARYTGLNPEKCKIAEFIVYGAVLSDPNRVIVQDYLKAKYGL